MNPLLSRREFLLGVAASGTALALPRRWRHLSTVEDPIPLHRVVHAHSNRVTDWDYATGWYGDHVDQALVDLMTDRGVMELTGARTRAAAWRALIPDYTAGQVVAIKINLNNAACDDRDQVIDALPQPVNAVISGLKAMGVPEDDIWVYDASRPMPVRVAHKIAALTPAVQFHAGGSGCAASLGFSTTECVHFDVPPGRAISDRPICNALARATYLINMPIMKKHGMAGVTLGFKNHFGSIEGCDLLHWSVSLGHWDYLATYSALVDLYMNPHFRNKTVLTVGDGLYAARINNYSEVPGPWATFGGHSPNSLFFSRDPVAIDCVMYDFLKAEGGVPSGSDDYLKLAHARGLGVFEHRDASERYHAIDYRRIEVDSPPPVTSPHHLYLPVVLRGR